MAIRPKPTIAEDLMAIGCHKATREIVRGFTYRNHFNGCCKPVGIWASDHRG